MAKRNINSTFDLMKKIIEAYNELENDVEMLYEDIYDTCSTSHFREIRYFSPDGKSMPNGVYVQRGFFLQECAKNKEAFVLDEAVHNEQYGLKKYRGGIIVFSTDINAVSLDKNKLKNRIKQILETFKQRYFKDNILHKTVRAFNQGSEEKIGPFSIGNIFKGSYVGDNGEKYDEHSTTIEINGLSSKGLLKLAEMICKVFHQETVLVKDFNTMRFYLADDVQNDSELDFENINPEQDEPSSCI